MSKPERSGSDVVESGERYIIDRVEIADPRPSYSVIEAVSEVTDTEPEALRPLHDVIDPDALDRLFSPDDSHRPSPSKGHLRFRYEGVVVTVHADGRTIVSEPGAEDI